MSLISNYGAGLVRHGPVVRYAVGVPKMRRCWTVKRMEGVKRSVFVSVTVNICVYVVCYAGVSTMAIRGESGAV